MVRNLLTIIFCTLGASMAMAGIDARCAPYGDEDTEYTWMLCPGGEKYERRYLYYGFWSEYYPVKSDAGACGWSAASSRWKCPDQTFRCNGNGCHLQ